MNVNAWKEQTTIFIPHTASTTVTPRQLVPLTCPLHPQHHTPLASPLSLTPLPLTALQRRRPGKNRKCLCTVLTASDGLSFSLPHIHTLTQTHTLSPPLLLLPEKPQRRLPNYDSHISLHSPLSFSVLTHPLYNPPTTRSSVMRRN